jgi:hypothetical protein
MSPPAGAAAPAVRPRRTAAPARPLSVPPRPRRVSGPARRRVEDRPARGRSREQGGLALALISAVDRLSRLRVFGGRTWIGLVAFALIGIVTLQLGLLKLNAGIGRALEHEALLQRQNATLSIENSELATSDRVASLAAGLGMQPVPTAALHFLRVGSRLDLARSAAALSTMTAGSATGSGEAPAGESSALTASSPTSASGEQSTSEQSTSAASGEPSTAGSPATGEPSAGSATTPAPAESTRASGESTRAPASEAPPAEAPSRSAEGTPAGGTSASPSG